MAKFADMRVLTIVAGAMTNGMKGLTGCRWPRNASASTSASATAYLLWVNRIMYTWVNGKSQIISATVVKDDKCYHIAHRFAGGRKTKLFISGVEEAAAANLDNTVLKDNKSLLHSIDESLNHIL